MRAGALIGPHTELVGRGLTKEQATAAVFFRRHEAEASRKGARVYRQTK
jgi:hypothetical protein